jgi:hypothetical protein
LTTSTDLALRGRGTFHFLVASRSWLTANPTAAAAVVCVFNLETLALLADPAAAAAEVIGEQGDEAAALAEFKGYSFLDLTSQAAPEYLGGGLTANLQSQIQALAGLAGIDADVTNADVTASLDMTPATAAMASG